MKTISPHLLANSLAASILLAMNSLFAAEATLPYTIVDTGHDHLYAKQDLDGIVYQEAPQPGDTKGSTHSAAEYGYKNGTILPSSGHMRIIVSASKTKIDDFTYERVRTG